MRSSSAISILFLSAAVYDGILGIAFLFASAPVFRWFSVTPPNHFGYVHFPAALLVVFAIMFLAVARAPAKNANLILYGILLKVAYCGVAFYHWGTGGIPGMWKPFAFFDLVCLFLFVAAHLHLRRRGRSN